MCTLILAPIKSTSAGRRAKRVEPDGLGPAKGVPRSSEAKHRGVRREGRRAEPPPAATSAQHQGYIRVIFHLSLESVSVSGSQFAKQIT
jgi:hypothetical protein